jgi:two-component system, LytTR family, sensor kinase
LTSPKKTIKDRLIKTVLRYKVLHVVFWLWCIADLNHERQVFYGEGFFANLPDVLIMSFGYMLAVYPIIYYLIPNFLSRGKYLLFALYAMGIIFIASCVTIALLQVYSYLAEGTFFHNYVFLTMTQFLDSFVIAAVFVAIVTISSHYQMQRRNNRLEKEKLQAELNFLQAQINPHFLFNALNTIYVLIDMNKKMASDTLLKFSGLLRYHLYDCKDSLVNLDTEINQLHDYIDLESLRIGGHVKVNFRVSPVIHHFRIAPFLLIPFIENAFKHVSREKDQHNFIDIDLQIDNNSLALSVENSCAETIAKPEDTGGIGLKNVVRRLDLLYPENYKLDVAQRENSYAVKLKLYGSKDEVYYS